MLTFYTGPSSNIAFLSHITNAVKATRDPLFSSRQVHPDSDAAIVNAPRPKAKRSRSAAAVDAGDPFTLPPEHEALDLAQEFFSNTASIVTDWQSGYTLTCCRGSCSRTSMQTPSTRRTGDLRQRTHGLFASRGLRSSTCSSLMP